MLESFHEREASTSPRALRELGDVAGERRRQDARRRASSATSCKKLEEDRFHLVVVGEFNHGKSTFVNALLGADVLPTGVTPTTAVIHHLVYADEPRGRRSSTRRASASSSRSSDVARGSRVGGGAASAGATVELPRGRLPGRRCSRSASCWSTRQA